MSDTTMSLNEQVMRALHPTWVKMGGYFNDGEGRGYVTPDFEHSVDASLEVIDPRRDVAFESDYDGSLQACWISPLTVDEDAIRGEGATRAEALARALLAWARKEAGR